MKRKSDAERIEDDAKAQYVQSRRGADNSGVSSAEPRVITGDEDATFDSHPKGDRSARYRSAKAPKALAK